MTNEDFDTVLERVGETVTKLFDGADYIWQANKGNDRLLDANGWIPHQPHGLNNDAYMRCHNVALLSALNHETPALNFLKDLGLDEATITATRSYQSDYQTALRCSLRDPDAIAPVNIIVPTRGGAEWIAARFPGSTIQHLDSGLDGPRKKGRPTKAEKLTSTQRSRLRRAAQKAKSL